MLRNGKFHTQMCDLFAPQLIRYVDLMETSIAQSTQKDFDKEKWITPDELVHALPNFFSRTQYFDKLPWLVIFYVTRENLFYSVLTE